MLVTFCKTIKLNSTNAYMATGNETEFVLNATYQKGNIVKIESLNSVYIAINQTLKSPTIDDVNWRLLDYLPYIEVKAYAVGVYVRYLNNIYVSLIDNNLTNPTGANTNWEFVKKTNAHDCLDLYFTSSTKKYLENLVMEIEVENCSDFSLFGLTGKAVLIEEFNCKNELIAIKNHALLDTSSIWDFASYCQFDACSSMGELHGKLSGGGTQKIRMTITAREKNSLLMAEVATMAFGKEVFLGVTTFGVSEKKLQLNPPTSDKWGNFALRDNDFIKLIDVSLKIPRVNYDRYSKLFNMLDGKPAVFKITDGTDTQLNTFGLYEDLTKVLDNNTLITASLRINSFKYKKDDEDCTAFLDSFSSQNSCVGVGFGSSISAGYSQVSSSNQIIITEQVPIINKKITLKQVPKGSIIALILTYQDGENVMIDNVLASENVIILDDNEAQTAIVKYLGVK